MDSKDLMDLIIKDFSHKEISILMKYLKTSTWVVLEDKVQIVFNHFLVEWEINNNKREMLTSFNNLEEIMEQIHSKQLSLLD